MQEEEEQKEGSKSKEEEQKEKKKEDSKEEEQKEKEKEDTKDEEDSGEFLNQRPTNCLGYLLYKREEPDNITELDLRTNGVLKAHFYSYRRDGDAKVYQKRGINFDVRRSKAHLVAVLVGVFGSLSRLSGWWPF